MTQIKPRQETVRPGRREQAQACLTVCVGAILVFGILAISGSLGWLEAITASGIMAAGTLAYYVGSSPAVRPQAPSPKRPVTSDSDHSGLIEVVPLPSILLDADTRIVATNAEARRLFRIPEGKHILASAAIRRPELLTAIDRVATGVPPHAERVPFSTQGETEEFWMAHIVRLEKDPGAATLVILEDRTATARARKARADFLANASHELRTPLTSISGFLETMRGPAKDDKDSWDGFIEIMQDQTDRMNRLIADLLSLSRIEFSEHKAPDGRRNVAKLVTKAVKSNMPAAAERNIDIQLIAPDTNAPIYIIADRHEIAQVVDNLITNAIKYAKKDSRIELAYGASPSQMAAERASAGAIAGASRMTLLEPSRAIDGPVVWLTVRDTGAGIPRTKLPRLGERFYRVDESRSLKVPGTGLGLAIVKHIMARHRGGLAVESLEGTGTMFRIWLPAAPPGAAVSDDDDV